MPEINGSTYTDDGRLEIHNEALPYIPAVDDVWINGTLHHGDHGHMIVSGSAFEGATDIFINGYRHTQHGVRYIMIPPAVDPYFVEGFAVEGAPANAGRMPIEGAAAVTSSRGAGRIATGEVSVEVVVPPPAFTVLFNLATYNLEFDAAPAPGGIVGVVIENDGNITMLEDGNPVGSQGTWFTGTGIVLNDYDIMYDQQNAFSPNQGFSLVNQWLSMGGGGGDAGQWRYEPASYGPPEDCDAILRIRDAGTLIEITTAQLTLGVRI